VTGWKRREARCQRRKAARGAKRNAKPGASDGFEQAAGAGNLHAAFKRPRRNAAWKESVQRYEAGTLRNAAATRLKLLAGESVRNGFAGLINGTSGEVVSFYEALKRDFSAPEKEGTGERGRGGCGIIIP
jgi:hypothetical protein